MHRQGATCVWDLSWDRAPVSHTLPPDPCAQLGCVGVWAADAHSGVVPLLQPGEQLCRGLRGGGAGQGTGDQHVADVTQVSLWIGSTTLSSVMWVVGVVFKMTLCGFAWLAH